MAWTDERVEKLRELWDKGLSASQIAKELAEGVTRNAVIGKAHRMGLASRPSPVKSDPAKRAAAAAKKKKAAAAVVGVWGGLAAVGWIATNNGPAPPVQGKK